MTNETQTVMAKEMPVMMIWMETVGQSSHVASVKLTSPSPTTPIEDFSRVATIALHGLQSEVRIRKVHVETFEVFLPL